MLDSIGLAILVSWNNFVRDTKEWIFQINKVSIEAVP